VIGPGDPSPLALLVEDDAVFRTSLAALVRAAGWAVAEASDVATARRTLERISPDLVVLDLELPDGHGLELRLDSALTPDTPFIVVSGDTSEAARRAALRRGAADYLTKPVEPERFGAVLHAIQAGRPLRAQVAELKASLREVGRYGPMVGRSAAMQEVYDLLGRVSPTGVPVLILGESGTGKELVARTIHEMSPRVRAPFVEVNCGAIPPTLIESKLFGHEKGSFTGADRRHHGVFEQAEGGTLFLDEIGEMPAELQVRLLRVLETARFVRVGGQEPLSVDVRILAATNRDPRRAIAEGRLREDLFHRLNVFPIHLPPLRDRMEDVELLARHFLKEINTQEARTKRLGADALLRLESAAWSGNVRELRNVLQRAWILADDVITADDVRLFGTEGPVLATPVRDGEAPDVVEIPVGTTVAEAERRLVLATLARCGGNKRVTAEMLGISVRTLYSRLQSYGAR